jgi:hypothetical protein
LGAVAAGSWSLADGLLADAATSWQVGAEYEDDYAYAAVLHAVARRGGASAAELDRLLETLERAGAETYGTRLDLIRALAAGVEAPFVDAFADAHREQEVLTETRARSLTTPVTSFAPHRYIWLEGLALLRLAEHAGLRIDREFLYCPPLARVPMAVAYSGDWVVSIGG